MNQKRRTMKRLYARPAADVSGARDAQAALISKPTARRLAAVFKSLSDPTRLRIISLAAEQEFCVTDLAAALKMEQSTISHQLRDMRQAGWVRYRREGRHVFYSLDDEHVRDLFRQALAHIGQA
jgi:DNA-binding transcriptional ArsR family regulator